MSVPRTGPGEKKRPKVAGPGELPSPTVRPGDSSLALSCPSRLHPANKASNPGPGLWLSPCLRSRSPTLGFLLSQPLLSLRFLPRTVKGEGRELSG